jgi:uncharacterized protein (TIGR02246 family)
MSQDRDILERFVSRFIEAWKTNDGSAVAGLFVEDGALINPFGQRADGRTAIGAMYSDYFAGMLRGTSTTLEVRDVRPVETTHVFVDGEQTVLDPGGEIVLTAHLAALLRREGDEWRFVDARPYIVPPIPG